MQRIRRGAFVTCGHCGQLIELRRVERADGSTQLVRTFRASRTSVVDRCNPAGC
jgi:RNA polymerase-binding transcription factor DksA